MFVYSISIHFLVPIAALFPISDPGGLSVVTCPPAAGAAPMSGMGTMLLVSR